MRGFDQRIRTQEARSVLSEKGVKAASGERVAIGRGPIGVGVGSEEQPTSPASRMH